jgi:hypothetical protein
VHHRHSREHTALYPPRGELLRKNDISPLRGSWWFPANQLVEGDLQGLCDVQKRLDRRIGRGSGFDLQVRAVRDAGFAGHLILGQAGLLTEFLHVLRYGLA